MSLQSAIALSNVKHIQKIARLFFRRVWTKLQETAYSIGTITGKTVPFLKARLRRGLCLFAMHNTSTTTSPHHLYTLHVYCQLPFKNFSTRSISWQAVTLSTSVGKCKYQLSTLYLIKKVRLFIRKIYTMIWIELSTQIDRNLLSELDYSNNYRNQKVYQLAQTK